MKKLNGLMKSLFVMFTPPYKVIYLKDEWFIEEHDLNEYNVFYSYESYAEVESLIKSTFGNRYPISFSEYANITAVSLNNLKKVYSLRDMKNSENTNHYK